MDGTQIPQLYSSLDKGKEEESADANGLELSLRPPGDRKSFTGSHQKRSSVGPVAGWPPVGSFRKNLAGKNRACSSSTSPSRFREDEGNRELETQNNADQPLFVKIYMEGFPIGRKVNLRAYDSYNKLSVAIDKLFGGLVAADRSNEETTAEEHGATEGSGEYTLVYEDNEGDRILAGDVPWIKEAARYKELSDNLGLIHPTDLDLAITRRGRIWSCKGRCKVRQQQQANRSS